MTVPGKYDKEYVGLYTLIEQVDRVFLKEHFGNADGMLLKPEITQGGGLPHFGADWKQYATASRLAYVLWNTQPDDALLDSAAKGELNDPAALHSPVES